MFYNSLNDKSEAQLIRQKKNTLKYLKEAFETQQANSRNNESKNKGDLEQLISKMRVQRLKQVFFTKLNFNNIYQPARKIELLSQQQFNKKRLIQWKGFKLHQHLLSTIYIIELIFLIVTFYISTCIAFLPNFIESDTHNSSIVIGLNAATALMSCMKIGITSTTQTIKKGIMLVYISDIFIAYAKSLVIFVDIIYLSIIIILFIFRSQSSEIINSGIALFIWSIIRISISNENLTYFRTTFIDSFKKQQYYKLLKVIIFNFIFAHFVASMLLAMSQLDHNENWMIQTQISHQVWYIQYMWSYYWATTIMMTVGFGDFIPITYKEGFIVSLIELFSCIVLAYNISQIGGIISTIRATQDSYIAKLGIFKRMAEQNSVDLELKIRIQDFLRQQKAIKERFEFNQQAELLESLPQSLRKEFIMASNGKIFANLPFFKGLHKNTIMNLTQIFKSKVYYPGQIISKANQNNNLISILKYGKVGMTYRKQDSNLNGIIVQQIQVIDRYYLNQVGKYIKMMYPILLNTDFLSPGKIVNYDMKVQTYAYVFQLNHQDFMAVIKSSQMDSDYFFSILHSTLIRKSGWEQFPCEQCQIPLQSALFSKKSMNKHKQTSFISNQLHFHTKFECPKLHFIPLKGIIIMKYNKTPAQPQIQKPKYKRKKLKTSSCLLLRKKAFKTYQRKRFINERKDYEKFVEKSISFKFIKYPDKQTKQYSEFRRQKQRKNSMGNCGDFQKNIKFKENDFERLYQYERSEQLDKSNIYQTNQFSSQEEGDCKTIIDSVVKFAIEEVYPRHISLTFWDLQIDMMWNYMNYFPQYNALRLDKIELVKNKVYKNKALCMVGQILKQSRVGNSLSLQQHRRAMSMCGDNLNNKKRSNFYKRKSSLSVDWCKIRISDDQKEKEILRADQLNSNESKRPFAIDYINMHDIRNNQNDICDRRNSSTNQEQKNSHIERQRVQSFRIIIPQSIRNYDQDESVLDEDTIEMCYNKGDNKNEKNHDVNQSSTQLNNHFWD